MVSSRRNTNKSDEIALETEDTGTDVESELVITDPVESLELITDLETGQVSEIEAEIADEPEPDVIITLEPELMPGPFGLMAYRADVLAVRLTWVDEHDNTEWRLYRAPAFVGRSFVELTRTSYVDRELVSGQNYSYKVAAINEDGILSDFSNSVSYNAR